MDKKAMYKFGYGLYVLTARDYVNKKDNGCIINTAIQVTTNPNMISITVNKANHTCDLLLKCPNQIFNISCISKDVDFSLFKRFGFQSGRDVDKFEGYENAKRSRNGLMYVTEGTNAYISAEIRYTIDLGSHYMFIAYVRDAEVLSDAESVTYDYYQKNIKPAPAKPADKKTGYVCKVCGYIYEGDPLPEDFVCPICKHGAQDFEKL